MNDGREKTGFYSSSSSKILENIGKDLSYSKREEKRTRKGTKKEMKGMRERERERGGQGCGSDRNRYEKKMKWKESRYIKLNCRVPDSLLPCPSISYVVHYAFVE